MKRNIQNQHEAFFISRTILGKVSLEIDSYLLGPFYSREEVLQNLVALHERTIREINIDVHEVKSIYLNEYRQFSRIETSLLVYQLEVFKKPLFQ